MTLSYLLWYLPAHIKQNSKWRPQLMDMHRIGNGQSDARRKLKHHGPAHDIRFCVNQDDTSRSSLADVEKRRKRKKKRKTIFYRLVHVDDHFQRYLHAYR